MLQPSYLPSRDFLPAPAGDQVILLFSRLQHLKFFQAAITPVDAAGSKGAAWGQRYQIWGQARDSNQLGSGSFVQAR
jgi:hypothetical protein